ncbi:MAG: cyclic pyranopterin monophosphate synthase MoaC [Bacteroidota bacterium]|nr:cyclic pyranopterin monophosphate synthase MoaC [Bacteroidota bacterium]
MTDFTHLDKLGMVNMVNVTDKQTSTRTATARAIVHLPFEVLQKFTGDDIQTKKGAVFQIAIIAGIMAAKKTGDLIPLCHPLALDDCKIFIGLENNELIIDCTTSITAKTGVEMEALTGVSVAALTVYDMCKALSHDIVIKEIKLLEKTGGKHDFKRE